MRFASLLIPILILQSCAGTPYARVSAADLSNPRLAYPFRHVTLDTLAAECPALKKAIEEILEKNPPGDPVKAEAFRRLPVPDVRSFERAILHIPRHESEMRGVFTVEIRESGFLLPPTKDSEWMSNGFWVIGFITGKNSATVTPVDDHREVLFEPAEEPILTMSPSYHSAAPDLLMLVRACFRGDEEVIRSLVRSLAAGKLWQVDDEDGWLFYEDLALPLHLKAIAALVKQRFLAAADQFGTLARQFPLSKRHREAAELAPLLKEMARRYPDGKSVVQRATQVEQWVEDLAFESPYGHIQPGGPLYRDEGALLQLMSADMAAVPHLIKALEDVRPTGVVYSWRDFDPHRTIYRVCDLAAMALEDISGRNVPDPFHELEPDVRRRVIEFFQDWYERFKGRPRLDRYLEALEKPSSDHHRDRVAVKIGELGSAAKSAAPVLVAALEKSLEGNEGFVETLGLIGAPEARTVLEKILNEPSGYARIHAAVSLDQLGFTSGAEWMLSKLPGLTAEEYHKDRFAWNDALKHFLERDDPGVKESIRAGLLRIYGDDPAEWPSRFRPPQPPK